MEILIILILILLAIISPIPIFKPLFVLLASLGTLISSVTLPYISQINGNAIVYTTLDPLFQWALGLALLGTTIILLLDMIDLKKKRDENESD
jgi:hypothetical protein